MRSAKIFFALAAIFFFLRGPYRALHRSVSIDFAVNYSSARLWIEGRNPYDAEKLKREFIGPGKGPENIAPKYATQPAVYPPSIFLLIAPIAWMSWTMANWVWCWGTVLLVAFSLKAVLEGTKLNGEAYWIAAGVLTAFSPIHTGVAMGNPSAAACALTALAVMAGLSGNDMAAGLLTGVGICLKPQIAVCAVGLLSAWRAYRSLALAGIVLTASVLVSALRAPSVYDYLFWMSTLRDNMRSGFASGGANDPGAGNGAAFLLINLQAVGGLISRNQAILSIFAWLVFALLLTTFFIRGRASREQQIAFAAVMTLLPIYHRYYDAQLLILAAPFIMTRLHFREARWLAGLLLIFALPLQTAWAVPLDGSSPGWLASLLLLRHQPLALFSAAVLLSVWRPKAAQS